MPQGPRQLCENQATWLQASGVFSSDLSGLLCCTRKLWTAHGGRSTNLQFIPSGALWRRSAQNLPNTCMSCSRSTDSTVHGFLQCSSRARDAEPRSPSCKAGRVKAGACCPHCLALGLLRERASDPKKGLESRSILAALVFALPYDPAKLRDQQN